MDKRTNFDIVQETVEDIYSDNPKLLKTLNFKGDGIEIENGKVKDFSSAFAGIGKKFLPYVCFHHGASYAVSFVDHFIKLCYDANEYTASSIPGMYFISKKDREEIDAIGKEREQTL